MLERDSCPNGRRIQSKCKCPHCATQDNRSARAEQRQQLQLQLQLPLTLTNQLQWSARRLQGARGVLRIAGEIATQKVN